MKKHVFGNSGGGGGMISLAMLYFTSLPNNRNPLRNVKSSTRIQNHIRKKGTISVTYCKYVQIS